MRTRFKVIAAALCTLVLAAMPMSAAWGDTESGNMTATNVVYKKADGTIASNAYEAARIESFTLDGKYNYQTVGTDAGKTTFTPTKSALSDVVKTKLLPQWSGVAATVFRDQANQLVDLYGYENNGGCMSQSGFDAYFNMSAGNNTKYKDETWSCYSLKSKLAQTYATHSGDPGWDQLTVSGVKQISSLEGAREMVGQALYDCENHKGLSAEEFLDVDESGESRLSTLDDDAATTGFANVVTSVNCKGSSADFDYVTFGIVFYDFEAVPVAAKDMTYVSGEFTTENNDAGDNISTISNGQQQSIVHTADLGNDVKETTSVSVSALAGAKVNQSIGANMSWSETESGEDTDISSDDGEGISASTSGWSSTTSMGLNWGASWDLAGAAGADTGHSVENQISKAVSTAIELPAHTSAGISHKTTKTTYSQTYQQPVILNYKVAFYATSGDFFSGGDGGINSGVYDKQSLVIKFDTRDEANPSFGCAATDDLYSRVFTNKWVNGYDTADDRTYETHSTASKFSKSTNIDWNSVISYANSNYGTNVENIAKTNYFYETPGKLAVDQDKTSSSVEAIYPLYGLASVTTPKTKYLLYTNDTLSRDSLPVAGYNKYGVPFYGFDSSWGAWNRCDENGNVINGGYLKSDDPVHLEGDSALVPNSGTRGGTIYLTWKVEDENAKPVTGESPEGQNLAAANISSPIVEIQVVDSALEDPSVEVANDTYTCFYKTPLVLNTALDYEVTDKTDKVISTQVKWESRELDSTTNGIHVDTDTGVVTFTKPGTYHVRPYVINNSNNKVFPITVQDDTVNYKWVTIVAAEHDMTHSDALPATCTSDGCIEHYTCSDCGKYFSDAEGANELSEQDMRIEATGHNWGDWTTVRQATSSTPGEQQRVCANDASHVETRALYQVHFEANGHGTAPADQTIAAGASVNVPEELTASGFVFEGWFTDESCTTSYDLGSAVEGNITLYAKWSTAKYVVAAMAIGKDTKVEREGEDGEQWILDPNVNGLLTVDGGMSTDEGGYIVSVREVEYGSAVVITATPSDNYGLREIAAVAAKEVLVEEGAETGKGGVSLGEAFTPNKMGANTYSFTMPDADVAVFASFDQVTITYDDNAPANAMVTGVPAEQTVPYGSTLSTPGSEPRANGTSGGTYAFGGWYTDKECTQPFAFITPVTEDITLYAKWVQTAENTLKVEYTLYDITGSDPASYSIVNYVKEGETTYDPTEYVQGLLADSADYSGYELYSSSSNYWFTDENCTTGFDFATTITTADTHLYAKIVPRQYDVSFYSDKDTSAGLLKQAKVSYGQSIQDAEVAPAAEKDGYECVGWINMDGDADWGMDAPVTGELKLYAKWGIGTHTVTFNANGHGTAPDAQTVSYGTLATEPAAPEAEGFTFGGWFKEEECQTPWSFDTDAVTSNTTLYAKWTDSLYTVRFDANGHGTDSYVTNVKHGEELDNATYNIAPPGAEVGYTFGGWYKEADFQTPWNFDNDTVTSDTTLYAKWTVNSYAVTISGVLNGSVTLSGDGVTEAGGKQAAYGSTVTLTATPSTAYGLKLMTVAMTSDSSSSVALKKTGTNTYSFIMPNGDVTVTLEFAQVTVTFDDNAPQDTTVSNVPAQQTIGYGTVPEEPHPDPTATSSAAKWVFAGWCTDKKCTQPYLYTPLADNTTLYAKWVEDGKYHTVTYTLYDIAGSNPESYSTSDKVYDNAMAYDLTGYVNDLISDLSDYTGYKLYTDNGATWFTDTDCTTAYSFPARVNSDIQLYAKIVPETYTVNFHSDDDTSVVSNTATFDYGTAIGSNAYKPSKAGHTLAGWKVSTDKDANYWDPNAPVTVNLDLYADWKVCSYNVTFNANGHGTAPDAQKVEYGRKATAPGAPSVDGYTFGGWYTDFSCITGNEFNFATTTIEGDTTLYAKWTANTYTVTFDMNGFGNSAVQTVSHGGKATEPNSPEAQGYTFGGWYTNQACTTAYDFNTQVTVDTTLYAKWTKNTYNVTFDANGHGTAPAAQQVEYYDKATKPTEALTAENYIFGDDWFTDQACTTAYNFEAPVTENLQLYAQWTGVEHKVAFDANGHGTAPAEQSVEYGKTASDPGSLAASGYVFGGWYTDQACTTAYDFATQVTSDITLYAKWTEQHTVTFDANGRGSAPAAQTVNHGATASNPGKLAVDGYIFGGWFTDQGCTKAYNFATPVTANIRLYAKWTRSITPARVAITKVSSPLKCKVTVKWGAANNADGYQVSVGGIVTNVNANKHSLSIVNKKLKAGKKYSVLVRAWHMNGTTKTYGKWSSEKSIKISKSYNAKTKKKVKAYKKANTKSAVKAKLKKGKTVKVLTVKGKWAKTSKGWVLKKNLKNVKITNKVTTAK